MKAHFKAQMYACLSIMLMELTLIGNVLASSGSGLTTTNPTPQQNPKPICASPSTMNVGQQVEKSIQCEQLPNSIQQGQALLSQIESDDTEKAFDFVCEHTSRDIRAFNKLNCGEPKASLDCDQKKEDLCQRYNNNISQSMNGQVLFGLNLSQSVSANQCSLSSFILACEFYGQYRKKAYSLGCIENGTNPWACTKAGYLSALSANGNYDACYNKL